MRTRHMTNKQLQVYGARIRLAWFRKAEELGTVVGACKHYGIPRSEYYYWHKRWVASGKQITSLYDLPRTPKSHANDTDGELVSLIIQLRLGLGYGERALETVLKRDYDVIASHHGIGNVLKRAGLVSKRPTRRRSQRRLSDYPYVPGEVGQMDVKHWKRAAYQYDLIDCATRIKYKRLYPDYCPANTVDFLEHATRFFGPAFSFETIQTDNGLEFTYQGLPHVREDTVHRVTRWLAEQGIEHRLIPPHSPQYNGRIERSHGVDKERYKRLTTNSYMRTELQEFLVEDCLDYNFYRPHSMLNMQTPVAYLQSLDGFAHATVDTSVLYV
ncbi:MAG: integrase core domain-containing protein [Candidatus Saccharimonadales bacterium]